MLPELNGMDSKGYNLNWRREPWKIARRGSRSRAHDRRPRIRGAREDALEYLGINPGRGARPQPRPRKGDARRRARLNSGRAESI